MALSRSELQKNSNARRGIIVKSCGLKIAIGIATPSTNWRNQRAKPTGATNWRNQLAQPTGATNGQNQRAKPTGKTRAETITHARHQQQTP